MTLYTPVLWFYAVMVSLVFGASVYETLVVHPAWSRKPPESFRGFVGTPVSRMNIPAFWVPVAPLYALSALAALGLAFRAGSQGVALIVSTACAVAGVAWTLVYFRPTIERFLEAGGGNTPTERLQIEAHRWIRLNWIRVGLVAISWWGASAPWRGTDESGWAAQQAAPPDGCVPFSAAAGEPRSLGTGRTRKENGPRN
jgi:hypothetical protein